MDVNRDRPPEQEVKVMRTDDYETAEMRLSGRVWWCWSITMRLYWKPVEGVWPGPEGAGHWPQCGWFTETPTPTIDEEDADA